MKTAMAAIIKKDFRGVTDNKHLFASLLIVPLVLTIVLPSTFLVMIHFAPDDPDIQRLLDLLPQSMQTKGLELIHLSEAIKVLNPWFDQILAEK